MFKRWWFAVSLFALYGIGIATGTDRFVSSANGDDLNGLNDCRDQSRPCKTIAHAIQKADRGDTILLDGARPYDECGLELSKTLTIKSEGIPAAVIAPNAPLDECKKQQDEKGEAAPFVFKISGEEAKGSTIEGIVIRARIDKNPDAALIILENTSGITVQDNYLVVLKVPEDKEGMGIGLKVLNSPFNKIIENKIQGTRDPQKNATGVLLRQQAGSGRSLAGNRLERNEIFDHAQDGIIIEIGDLQPSSENPLYLLENVVKNNGGFGVDVRTTSNLKIKSKNKIINNGNAGIQFSSPCQAKACESIEVIDNIIDSNVGAGISLIGKDGAVALYKEVRILGNEIRNKHLSGIVLAKGQYNQVMIANNTLDRNQQEGIKIEELEGGSSLELKDNAISGTTKREEGEGHGVTIKLTNKIGATKLVVSGDKGNRFEKNAGSGLVLDLEGFNTTDGSEVRIERLISEGNREGIVLKNSQKVTVQSGQFNSNSCAGLILENSSDNTISNNTIESNGHSCSPSSNKFQIEGAGVILKDSSKLNTFEKNKLSYNLNGFSLRLSQSPEVGEGNHFLCNGIYKSDHSGILILPEASVTALPDSFNNNNIVGNLGFGLRNFTNIMVNAQQNWWGDKSGPRHETNPDGKGDRILGPADFGNWLTQPVDINRCP